MQPTEIFSRLHDKVNTPEPHRDSIWYEVAWWLYHMKVISDPKASDEKVAFVGDRRRMSINAIRDQMLTLRLI